MDVGHTPATDFIGRKAGAAGTVRVFVHDTNDLSRAGLAAILESEPGIVVVGQSAEPGQLVDGVRFGVPDVVLLNLDGTSADVVRGLLGIEVVSRFRIAAICAAGVPEVAVEALRHGAGGVLSRNAPKAQLVDEVLAVARGTVVLQPYVVRTLVERFDTPSPAPTNVIGQLDGMKLTARQRDVLNLVIMGYSNAEIAETLNVARSTVKSHLSAILRHLGLRDRSQLIVYAQRFAAETE